MWAVVPCKRLSNAKRRLSAWLSASECRRLVTCMLSDVLGVLSRCGGLKGVLVVSSDPLIGRQARELGIHCLAGGPDRGLSRAVAGAGRWLERVHADGLVVVPGDVPLVSPQEVAAVLRAAGSKNAVVLIPDRHGVGTNLLAARPVDAVPFLFGGESFNRHMAAARERGIEPTVIRSANLGLDIDTREDLAVFAREPTPTLTYDYLATSGVLGRFAEGAPEATLRAGSGHG